MGILTSGFGAAGLIVPAVVWLIDQYGWRWAEVFFGIGGWVLCIPLALLVKSPPEEVERRKTSVRMAQPAGTISAGTILKRKDFWLLSLAVFFGGVAGSAVVVHQIPYLVSIGISRQTAGFLVVVLSLSNVTGRMLFGWLGDFLDRRYCWVIVVVIKAAGVLAFAFSRTVGQFIPSLIALGVGFGGLIPLRPTLQIELFGMTDFATVQGLLMVFITLGTIISPPFAGWIFDLTGKYQPAFIILGVVTLLAIPMILATSGKTSRRSAIA
jgi:MFS family permease